MKELSTLDTIIKYALTPLSWAYGAAVTVRNKLFDLKILKEKEYDIPIICVGNITVGGTGKTPHVEYLISKLALEYKIGVVSRGYKRKTKGFLMGNSRSTPDSIGDEPYQIYQKFGHRVKVAVCEKRREGIERLLKHNPEINLILLDDAFQHRYVKPSISILLADYNRPVWEDNLLPLGRLRESQNAIDRADLVVITKCPEKIPAIDVRVVRKGLDLLAFQKLFFSRYEEGQLVPVFPEDKPYNVSLHSFTARDSVLLVTGIAQPRNFVRYFHDLPMKVKVCHFSDHHDFTRNDLLKISRQFDEMKGERKIIITTEKDSVRLLNNPYYPEDLKQLTYYIPVTVKMMDDIGDGYFIDEVRNLLGLADYDTQENPQEEY
ncbi:MAG: tetraacyldisaccharide 4'-kinase [Muribaculaceae bacterium]|nr:tetraacyldisaccharide 4'-kinase [Muribaculaceae bacterium]